MINTSQSKIEKALRKSCNYQNQIMNRLIFVPWAANASTQQVASWRILGHCVNIEMLVSAIGDYSSLRL